MKQANTKSELEDILTHFSRLAKMRSSSPDSWQVLLDSLLAWHQQELERAVAEARREVLKPFVRVLRDPGSHPMYHFEQVDRLKAEWPMLHTLLIRAEDQLTNKKEGK